MTQIGSSPHHLSLLRNRPWSLTCRRRTRALPPASRRPASQPAPPLLLRALSSLLSLPSPLFPLPHLLPRRRSPSWLGGRGLSQPLHGRATLELASRLLRTPPVAGSPASAAS